MYSLPSDPNLGQWKSRRPLQDERSHPAVAVYGGKIYVIGGGGPNFLSLNTVEIYDPRLDTWSYGPSMPTKRSGAAAFVFQGKIYVVGGGYKKPDGKFMFLPTVEIFDPEAWTWETGPAMLMPHDYPAFAQTDDTLFILGGHHPEATEGGPQTDPGFAFCEALTIGDRAWKETPSLPVPRFAVSAVMDGMGRILATGGVAFTGKGLTEYDRIDVYDPSSASWGQESGWSLPWPSAAHAACLIGDTFYLFAGFSTDWIHTRCAVYRPSNKSWNALSSLEKPRAAMGIAVLGNEIFLIGGWEKDGRSVMPDVVSFS